MKTHKKSILLTFVLFAATAFAEMPFAAGTYEIDPAHSKVGFEVPHLVISSVEGRFDSYSGQITLGKSFADSLFAIEIDTKSIDTTIKKRDDHLRSADFFDSSKFPKMSFKNKRIEGSADSFKATGDLTIKGVTKSVVLDGKYLGTVKDGYGNQKAVFQAGTKISRKEFGLVWNSMVEAGPVVGDEVTISIKIQAAKNK